MAGEDGWFLSDYPEDAVYGGSNGGCLGYFREPKVPARVASSKPGGLPPLA